MVERQNVPLEFAVFDVVPEREQRVVATGVASVVSEQPLAGHQVIVSVTIQVAQRHGVELTIIGFDVDLAKAAVSLVVNRLDQDRESVDM